MNPTLFEIGVAIIMVAVSIALVVWFSRYMAAASGRRMMHMLTRAGVDPEVAKHGDTEAIIQDVRSRCRRCRFEDLCDRWLAGKVEGDNSFCPNAQIFRSLTRTTGGIAP
ncbi:MAG: hypothetical protein HY527_22250 [Betaproteobacteria bacterium]|nr:hypothetical protein [Betaproteobacteria bacterium]